MRTTKKRKKRLIAIISVFILLAAIWHIGVNVNPILRTVSEEKVKISASVALQSACLETINANFKYKDLIEISYDKDGNVTLMQVNTPIISALGQKVNLKAQEKMNEVESSGIEIPLGTLSGITVLSGRGPNIGISVYPIGAVETAFKSQFIDAGINQTNHKIKLVASTIVKVVMPGYVNKVVVSVETLILESVIVGKVPDTYLQSGTLDEMLNLVP